MKKLQRTVFPGDVYGRIEQMSSRKVVVTGIGVVAAPVGMDDLWKGPAPPSAPGFQLVANWGSGALAPKREHRRLDRFTQFALVAAHEALEQAGPLDVDPTRVTVSVATGHRGPRIARRAGSHRRCGRAPSLPVPDSDDDGQRRCGGISIKYGFGGQGVHAFSGLRRRHQAVLDGLRQIQGLCRCGGGWRHGGGGAEIRRRGSRRRGRYPEWDRARSTLTATGLSWEKGRGSWSSRTEEAAIERGANDPGRAQRRRIHR